MALPKRIPREPIPELGWINFRMFDLSNPPDRCRWCGLLWWRCQGVLICARCDRTWPS